MKKLVKNIDVVLAAKAGLDMLLFVIGLMTGMTTIAVVGIADLMVGTGVELLMWFLIGMIYFKREEKKARN